jgi:hypothetical protein
MKIILELPREYEVRSCEMDATTRRISIVPRFAKNRGSADILFAQVSGDAGQTRTAILAVNARTGNLSVIRLDDTEPEAAFDAPLGAVAADNQDVTDDNADENVR